MATGSEPTGGFSFSLGTMFVVVTIVACTIAAASGAGPVVAVGVAMVTIGYWLQLRTPTREGDFFAEGWLLSTVGPITSVMGLLMSTAQ